MRLMLLAPAVLLSSVTIAEDKYELHYFEQDHSVCAPCIPVAKIVSALQNQGREVTVHNFQEDESVFKKFGINQTPSFLLLKNGQRYRYYEQTPGYKFTGQFLMGIAPPSGHGSAQSDCANPIRKFLKNVLPPPPAPGVRDVPDTQKVERTIRLEAKVRDLEAEVASLKDAVKDATQQRADIVAAMHRMSDVIKDIKPSTNTTEQVTQYVLDDRPVIVRMQGYRVLASGEKVVTVQEDKSYPRGTPVVLQFHESFLTKGEP
jgi:hypothetical protein